MNVRGAFFIVVKSLFQPETLILLRAGEGLLEEYVSYWRARLGDVRLDAVPFSEDERIWVVSVAGRLAGVFLTNGTPMLAVERFWRGRENDLRAKIQVLALESEYSPV